MGTMAVQLFVELSDSAPVGHFTRPPAARVTAVGRPVQIGL